MPPMTSAPAAAPATIEPAVVSGADELRPQPAIDEQA
jgi:hypothetical protein